MRGLLDKYIFRMNAPRFGIDCYETGVFVMKRIFIMVIIAGMILLPYHTARAENVAMSQESTYKAAVLIEAKTGTRLWEKNADEGLAVAGLSKLPAILTLAQSMDDGSLSSSASIRVSQRAATISGPTAFLEAAEDIDAAALMKAAVMISAGDAITALGETAYGSESVFCANINVTLQQLGVSSSLTDSLGSAARFSAYELALLGTAACESGTFSKYCALYLDEIVHMGERRTELVNANRLLNNYAGYTGLLTGSSQTDGYCGVFSASRNGTTFIVVIIGAESATIRTAAATELLDYGFANFRLMTLAQEGEVFAGELAVRDGDLKSVNLVAANRVDDVVHTQDGALTKRVNAPEYLEAPFDTETVLGSVDFLDSSGNEVLSIPLYASAAVRAFGVKDIIMRILQAFIGGSF